MSDIFFSYSSKDRERVRQVCDTLTTEGFNVFWDQAVPVGIDWDTWIRQHLASSKCVMVFWSANSVASDNVRHEATVARQQGKLVPVLLESLAADQFPMGLYSTQGANLASWTGNPQDPEWEKLKTEVEAKLTPLWVRQRIQELEAELLDSNARWEALASRDRTFKAQIDKSINAQLDLTREKDLALEEIENLKAQIAELTKIHEDKERTILEFTENLTNSRQELAVALQEIDEEKRRYIEQKSLVEKLSIEKDMALKEIENLKAQVDELNKVRAAKDLSIRELTEKLPKTQNELAITLQQLDEEKRRYIEQQSQAEKLSAEKDLALKEIENLKAQVDELTKIRTAKDLSIRELTEKLPKTQKELAVALQQLDGEKRRYIEQQSQVEMLATEKETFAQRLNSLNEHCATIELRLKKYENDEERSFKQETSAKSDGLTRGPRENIERFLKWCIAIFLFILGLFVALAGLRTFSDQNTPGGVTLLLIVFSGLMLFAGFGMMPRRN